MLSTLRCVVDGYVDPKYDRRSDLLCDMFAPKQPQHACCRQSGESTRSRSLSRYDHHQVLDGRIVSRSWQTLLIINHPDFPYDRCKDLDRVIPNRSSSRRLLISKLACALGTPEPQASEVSLFASLSCFDISYATRRGNRYMVESRAYPQSTHRSSAWNIYI